MKTSEREISDEEQRHLQEIVDAQPGSSKKLIMTVANWALSWIFFMLLLIAAWLIVAWVVRKAIDIEIGRGNDVATLWVVGVGGVLCAIYSTVSTVRWLRGWINLREPILADIANQHVSVEEYEFHQAIRMQEQEHGGLLYFMRENDNSAFAFFDHESQDLGVQGKDPLSSTFVPRQNLRVVRAPVSGVAISSDFSGDALAPGDPVDLMAPPEKWPEHEEISKISWDNLIATYAG